MTIRCYFDSYRNMQSLISLYICAKNIVSLKIKILVYNKAKLKDGNYLLILKTKLAYLIFSFVIIWHSNPFSLGISDRSYSRKASSTLNKLFINLLEFFNIKSLFRKPETKINHSLTPTLNMTTINLQLNLLGHFKLNKSQNYSVFVPVYVKCYEIIVLSCLKQWRTFSIFILTVINNQQTPHSSYEVRHSSDKIRLRTFAPQQALGMFEGYPWYPHQLYQFQNPLRC